ncbi:hypothetical protein, partial [Streptomyces cadmiisoli]|uniref:hypothetical protein n=1 Tax=Streptomyces cadmiisoli TaxID=2184053 RepID=UPI0036655811
MRIHALRRALVPVLAACAVTALAPATASAVVPGQCRSNEGGYTSDLRPGQRLESGQSLVPTPGKPELVMQSDGNLVVYATTYPGGPKLPLWYSGTYGNPGAYALMQEDGNFVIYKQGGGPQTGGAIWQTASYGDHNDLKPVAKLESDGNFKVIGRKDDRWGTHWSPLRREKTTKLCAEDTAHQYRYWFDGDWAQSATVWMIIQQDNNLVMYRKRDGKAIWNSGTYGGSQRVTLQMLYKDRGDLTIANASLNNDGAVRWRTYTGGNPDAWALLQDDGNFVVYKK